MDALQTVSMPGFLTLDIILWVFVGYTIFIIIYFITLTHIKSWDTTVSNLADGLISRNIVWSKHSASCVMYNHLTNSLKD